MNELRLNELSLKQKLGMVTTAMLSGLCKKESIDSVIALIKERALGAVWVQWHFPDAERIVKMVKDAADYPILIMTDAEAGIGEYAIGKHNVLGRVDKKEYAYAFGKAIGCEARRRGYNVVCNPVLDSDKAGSVRQISTDIDRVCELALSEAKGMHDGGVLTVGKHYPSAPCLDNVDSHMACAKSYLSKEELLKTSLKPYLRLMEEDLLDGLMVAHQTLINVDSEYPASLSEKDINIIREAGFDGFLITDALEMMAIRSMFSDKMARGLAVNAGNTFILPFVEDTVGVLNDLEECYNEQVFSLETLDKAVEKVLHTQHKAFALEASALTEKEHLMAREIDKISVDVRCDEGLNVSISPEGRHYFVIMMPNEFKMENGSVVQVDTFNHGWNDPTCTEEAIRRMFPASTVKMIFQFPTHGQNAQVLGESVDYDDIVLMTYTEPLPYIGDEHLTRRFIALVNSAQYTNRVSTVVHFGNPLVLEELPHVPRIIFGSLSPDSVEACLEVLVGRQKPTGKLTCKVKLK
jgi:beta-glucosidase-like glycosyl hydrolase